MPDTSERRLLGLVEQIYRAAAEPSTWDEVLQGFCALFDAHMGLWLLQDVRREELSIAISRGADAELMAEFQEHWAPYDFWLARAPHFRPGDIALGSELFAPSRMPGHPFYEGLLVRLDVEYQLAAVVDGVQNGRFCTLSVQRSRRRGNFDEADRALFRLLLPHLENAYLIHHRLRSSGHEAALGFASLDRLSHGVVVYDIDRRVVFANQTARRFIALRDGLGWGPRGLTVAWPAAERRLADLLAAVSRATARTGTDPGGALRVPRPSGAKPWALVVLPLAVDGAFGAGAAAVMIVDPNEGVEVTAAVLAELFGLTPAEVRLVQVLARGLTLREASDALSVTEATVRDRVKTVFAKTGTRRQSELVALVTRLGQLADRR